MVEEIRPSPRAPMPLSRGEVLSQRSAPRTIAATKIIVRVRVPVHEPEDGPRARLCQLSEVPRDACLLELVTARRPAPKRTLTPFLVWLLRPK